MRLIGCETGGGRSGGKIEWKSSKVITRAASKVQNELIGKVKTAAVDVIRGHYIRIQRAGGGGWKISTLLLLWGGSNLFLYNIFEVYILY